MWQNCDLVCLEMQQSQAIKFRVKYVRGDDCNRLPLHDLFFGH